MKLSKFVVFLRLYLDELSSSMTNVEAYERAEEKFERMFGRRAYKSNEVFKVVLSRNKKRLKENKNKF
ncbi:MAG: hypothetical protein ABIK73_07420 [candidate division WOR-3 bacterium]